MKLIVIGAGAWGTALAVSAAGRHPVTLWARDTPQVAQMRQARENARYLPGIGFPEHLQVEGPAAGALDRLAAAHDQSFGGPELHQRADGGARADGGGPA